MEPTTVPTRSWVRGRTMISRIMKGIARSRLMATPRMLWRMGMGRMPSLSVTTRIIPRGIPIK